MSCVGHNNVSLYSCSLLYCGSSREGSQEFIWCSTQPIKCVFCVCVLRAEETSSDITGSVFGGWCGGVGWWFSTGVRRVLKHTYSKSNQCYSMWCYMQNKTKIMSNQIHCECVIVCVCVCLQEDAEDLWRDAGQTRSRTSALWASDRAWCHRTALYTRWGVCVYVFVLMLSSCRLMKTQFIDFII